MYYLLLLSVFVSVSINIEIISVFMSLFRWKPEVGRNCLEYFVSNLNCLLYFDDHITLQK